MHIKLFLTIIGAMVMAYTIIRWLESRPAALLAQAGTNKREIGFASLMKRSDSASLTSNEKGSK